MINNRVFDFPVVYVLFLLALPILAHTAPKNELFGSIELHELNPIDQYEIDNISYFSSDYKVVAVNSNVLINNNEMVEIELFDNSKLLLKKTNLNYNNETKSWVWTGSFHKPRLKKSDIGNRDIDGNRIDNESKTRYVEFANGVKFNILSWGINTKTGEKDLSSILTKRGARADKDIGDYQIDTSRTIFAEIQNPITGDRYRLMPLETNPDIHIFLQIDAEKLLLPSDEFDTSESDALKQKRKYREQAYKQHKNSLIKPKKGK